MGAPELANPTFQEGRAYFFFGNSLGVPASTPDWTFETVAVTNTPAPGGTVPFLGLSPVPVINDAGDVTFSGTTTPAFGVFHTGLYQRLNGVNLLIVREGDAVPAAGGALIREFDQFNIARATMNASLTSLYRVRVGLLPHASLTACAASPCDTPATKAACDTPASDALRASVRRGFGFFAISQSFHK